MKFDRSRLSALLFRGSVFTIVWWILAEGHPASWGVGAVSISGALAASLLLAPPSGTRFSFIAGLRFGAFFLLESIRGGSQVALAALAPGRLRPGLTSVVIGLPDGLPRVLLMNTLNLLPGTVSIQLEGDTLWLHVLDRRQAIEREVAIVETHLARMLLIERST
ncbi:MAG: Na+/H+ antiporter subunit E [Thiobacillus sp.]|nr:Na+/H+ antiporter subunit E [Thiobacillus sp.]